MVRNFVETFLKRVALVAAGLSTGQAAALAAALEEIPERALIQVLEDSPDSGSDEPEMVLELLALDSRPAIRSAVADECGDASVEMAWQRRIALLRRLAGDGDGRVRSAAAVGLRQLLRSANPWERLEVFSSWAADPDPRIRLALARAVPGPPVALGVPAVLDALAADQSSAVRAEAARAARRLGGRRV